RLLHVRLAGVEDRIAAGLLVAAGNQRVARQRIGVRDRALLFDEHAKHAGLQRGKNGRSHRSMLLLVYSGHREIICIPTRLPMPNTPEVTSMALFCDFENIALGVRDASYEKFDIGKVLERLLLKGSIVVKKAYCDWDRYKTFKAPMHEASFELIEIPHVRQSGKNSADIRMVVDALDLCYTKSHVDAFVIVSGDSDFSPLVSKLRENAKNVIGVGVKNSTSDLLI